MTKLEELEKKIYQPDAEFGGRPERPRIFEPGRIKSRAESKEWFEPKRERITAGQRKILRWLGVISAAAVLIAAGLTVWRSFSFDKSKVELTISGPERIISGEEAVYLIRYKNKTKTTLKKIKLVFYYPEESLPSNSGDLIQNLDLADLDSDLENQTELKVRIIGLKNSQKKAQAKLSYEPKSVSSRFENQAEFSTRIISVPLVLDFNLPERLVSGQDFSFSLKYFNESQIPFKDLRLKLEYPPDFRFQSAEPSPSENENLWLVGDLAAGKGGKLFINGTIEGNEGESKSFKAQLGLLKEDQFIPYAETIEAFQIVVSPLFISQTINGAADYIAQAGEVLNYEIDYKNTTDVGIKNAVIIARLEGSALDLATLNLEQGSFDGISQEITWKASNLPVLEFLGPQQEGKIKFSVKIKDPLPIKNYSDKNFIITSAIKIDSSQAPLSLSNIQIKGESQLKTKIASRLILLAKGYFRDDLIPNSGPIPPKVGQTTTYTIKWQLTNTSNDLKDVKVIAYLPPHVEWLNKIEPSQADLKYNSQTGQMIWSVGFLAAGTGFVLPVQQVAFQVAIRPSLNQVGGLVELIGQSKAAGKDTFTDLELSGSDEPIDTDLPDDTNIGSQGGVVVE